MSRFTFEAKDCDNKVHHLHVTAWDDDQAWRYVCAYYDEFHDYHLVAVEEVGA